MLERKKNIQIAVCDQCLRKIANHNKDIILLLKQDNLSDFVFTWSI